MRTVLAVFVVFLLTALGNAQEVFITRPEGGDQIAQQVLINLLATNHVRGITVQFWWQDVESDPVWADRWVAVIVYPQQEPDRSDREIRVRTSAGDIVVGKSRGTVAPITVALYGPGGFVAGTIRTPQEKGSRVSGRIERPFGRIFRSDGVDFDSDSRTSVEGQLRRALQSVAREIADTVRANPQGLTALNSQSSQPPSYQPTPAYQPLPPTAPVVQPMPRPAQPASLCSNGRPDVFKVHPDWTWAFPVIPDKEREDMLVPIVAVPRGLLKVGNILVGSGVDPCYPGQKAWIRLVITRENPKDYYPNKNKFGASYVINPNTPVFHVLSYRTEGYSRAARRGDQQPNSIEYLQWKLE